MNPLHLTLILFFLSFSLFGQTFPSDENRSIKNLTQAHVVPTTVDLTYSEKKIIALVNGSKQLEYKLTGETINTAKEFGNMVLVITNKNLIAASTNANEFARQPLYGDTNISFTISNCIVFVVSNKKIYSYTVSSSEWRTIDLTGEIVRTHAAFDKTGALITNKRIISYSEYIKEFHFYKIDDFTPINSFNVLDNKIVFESNASPRKTIIYRAQTGEYSVVNFN
ncbi:MAG TPA: hypothetical protein PK079_09440 [Leptospiraceae bacterium]|nr:hypothetical protein [Leptospiraceae bacterium]HMW06441.1 hypothetical protein [Leptospiraceae bacterium]HMX31529.1 hypothetical protein [Leptospiraceae bacterium]HMY31932.1 hypothetical protein [Leptospiraceae bacterium]HMZ63203.1 hypothetical protein [Leptospiraceae bacterium]